MRELRKLTFVYGFHFSVISLFKFFGRSSTHFFLSPRIIPEYRTKWIYVNLDGCQICPSWIFERERDKDENFFHFRHISWSLCSQNLVNWGGKKEGKKNYPDTKPLSRSTIVLWRVLTCYNHSSKRV